MKQLYNSPRREEVAQVKRILEEHLLPCLLVTDGEGDWKIFLNIATYDTDFTNKVAQADEIIRQYGYDPAA